MGRRSLARVKCHEENQGFAFVTGGFSGATSVGGGYYITGHQALPQISKVYWRSSKKRRLRQKN